MEKIITWVSILLFSKRNRILAWLTGILIIMLFLIIKYCDIPLWLPERYFSFLLCNPNGDKTLYNIAISYLAAYLFYIIQVHIPAMQRETRAYKAIRKQLSEIIRDSKEIIYVFNEMYDTNEYGGVSEKNTLCYLHKDFWDIYPATVQSPEQMENDKYKHSSNASYDSESFCKKLLSLKEKYIKLLGMNVLEKCDENFVVLLESFAVDKLCSSIDGAITLLENKDLINNEAFNKFSLPALLAKLDSILKDVPGTSINAKSECVEIMLNGQPFQTIDYHIPDIRRSSTVLQDIKNSEHVLSLLETFFDVDSDIAFRACTDEEKKQLEYGKEFGKEIQRKYKSH